MAIPKFVQHKRQNDSKTSFTNCPRDSCNGKVEKSETIASKLGLSSAVFVCRSCGAQWKAAKEDSPEGSRGVRESNFLKYVRGSCDERDSVSDEQYRPWD